VSTYADSNKEFIEVDVAIAICVEECHESTGFGASDADLNLAQARVELLGINLMVAIEGIEVSEGSSEASNCLSTARYELFPHARQNYI